MDVWHVDLALSPRAIEREARLLDAQELARASRLRGPLLQRRFIAAHAALRRILGARLHQPPQALTFWHEPSGRPRVSAGGPHSSAGRSAPHFSLSHAADHALVAVCTTSPVGIDLETDPLAPDLVQDLQSHLAPSERAELATLPATHRPRAACRCWVRKEALLKALGCGLAGDLSRLAVSVGEEARLLSSTWPGLEPASWSLVSLDWPGHWIAALAVAGGPPRVRRHRWDWCPEDAAVAVPSLLSAPCSLGRSQAAPASPPRPAGSPSA